MTLPPASASLRPARSTAAYRTHQHRPPATGFRSTPPANHPSLSTARPCHPPRPPFALPDQPRLTDIGLPFKPTLPTVFYPPHCPANRPGLSTVRQWLCHPLRPPFTLPDQPLPTHIGPALLSPPFYRPSSPTCQRFYPIALPTVPSFHHASMTLPPASATLCPARSTAAHRHRPAPANGFPSTPPQSFHHASMTLPPAPC
jgi:hypothetical protein